LVKVESGKLARPGNADSMRIAPGEVSIGMAG
jgi:hypothetical protein